MPSKLLLHPNERLDKTDLDYAASGYAQGLVALDKKTIMVGRRSQVTNGFRLEVADQTAAPGEITIHNGSYVDITGKLVTNEETLTSSQTVTLLGANGTFYIELTFVDSDGTLDDRAFWDPTFDNGTGALKGKEYLQEVNTRTSTIWSVVSPVSTTGFAFTADEQSQKVPYLILKTDSLGRITSSVNPGFVTGAFSTTLEEDVSAGANKIRVFDATLLLDVGGHILIGGENKIISNIDRSSGVVQITTTLASSHARGTIVYNVGGPTFMWQRTGTTVQATAGSSTHPDKLRRFFSGDEGRGNALMASADVAGARNDLQLRNLKDQIDFLSAQIREMKLGGVTTTLPSNFSAARYYDFVGSIQGAKTANYTVGDGTATYGDFNGTDQTPFQAAHDAAVARGFTEVVIAVKPGFYEFTAPVAHTISMKLDCQNVKGLSVELVATSTAMFDSSAPIEISGGFLSADLGIINCVAFGVEATLRRTYCSTGASSFVMKTTSTATARIYSCNLSSIGDMFVGPVINGLMFDTDVDFGQNCYRIIGTSTFQFTYNRFTTSSYANVINLDTDGTSVGTLQDSDFSNNIVTFTATGNTGSVLGGQGSTINCTFNANKITCNSAANNCKMFSPFAVTDCAFEHNNFTLNLAAGSNGTGVGFLDTTTTAGLVFSGNSMINNASRTVDTSSTCLGFHSTWVKRARITGNTFTGFSVPIAAFGVTSSSDVVITSNVFNQPTVRAVSLSGTFSNVTVNNNTIDGTIKGGVLISASSGACVQVCNNIIRQSTLVSTTTDIGIAVTQADNVSICNNVILGTNAATAGAGVTRSAINLSSIPKATIIGNQLFWNPIDGGTTDMAEIYLVDVVESIVNTNYGTGVLNGSALNLFIRSERTTGSANTTYLLNNVIKGDSSYMNGRAYGSPLPTFVGTTNVFTV
ncbi:MAG: hypothetical protein JWO15_3678 [Sphingomonadales bacterium]|nr:hypothetical protein [Sphingomonadales bacterium]